LATNKIEVEELRWNELEVFNFMEMLTSEFIGDGDGKERC
jgi:hypothetical protein